MSQHPTRPWWRFEGTDIMSAAVQVLGRFPRWVRTDGVEVSRFHEVERDFNEPARQDGFLKIPAKVGRFPVIEARPEDEIEADLARIDRENPLPVPEPACGQVWRTTRDRGDDVHTVESLVVSVDRDAEGKVYEVRMLGAFHSSFGGDFQGRWPPNGHQANPGTLIAGPGAPWWPESRS